MIEIENLTAMFKTQKILDDVTFSVKKNEVIAIIGPSGGGKSTILRCINGLNPDFQGRISVDGIDVNQKNIKKIRSKVGMIFQNFNLFNNLNILENLILAPTELGRISKNEAIEKANIWLEKVGLGSKTLDIKNKMPKNLSGGQKQRVAIARALMLEPEVLLCDEPTSALDPENVSEVLNVLKSLSENDMTILLVTHEMKFAEEVSDRVIFLEEGKIIENSETAQFFKEASSERARRFLQS